MAADATIIPTTKQAPACWGRVLILGLGKSGRIAAHYCLSLLGKRVDSVRIAAGARTKEALAFAHDCEQRGAHVTFDDSQVEGSFDVCIASPGISEFSELYVSARAASREIMSEVEFAWRESDRDSRWIAITGTNNSTDGAHFAASGYARSCGWQYRRHVSCSCYGARYRCVCG